MDYNFKLVYKVDGEPIEVVSSELKLNNDDFSLEIACDPKDLGSAYQAVITPKKKLTLLFFSLFKDQKIKKDDYIFVNGYQSWTDTKEFTSNEHHRNLDKLPKLAHNLFHFKSYGDAFFKDEPGKKGMLHGYSYAYVRDNDNFHLWGSKNDFNAFTIINFNCKDGIITLESDVKGLVIEKEFTLLNFIDAEGAENDVFELYKKEFKLPKVKVEPTNGFSSWYNYYQNINESIILTNLDEIAKAGHKLFQIDDGYESFVGDWDKVDSVKFPNGIKPIREEITAKGMKAGIWMAPVVAETKSQVFKDHPDWFLKDDNGQYIYAGCNWSGFYAMDFYNPEVQQYMKDMFKFIIKDCGFELLKLDFLYAACLKVPANKTRAQVMREVMQFIRDNTFGAQILGCGVPLVSAAGLVDYCRIGADVCLRFDDLFFMRIIHRERVSTKLTLMNTISRRHLNNWWFLNDPDVYLLRDENMHMNKNQRQSLALINHIFGGIYLTSDEVGKYNISKRKFAKICDKFKDAKYSDVKRDGKYYVFDVELEDDKYHFIYNIKKGVLKYGKI